MANITFSGLFDRNGLDPELFVAYDRKGAEKAGASGEQEEITPEGAAKQ